jgi:hypothetical protein
VTAAIHFSHLSGAGNTPDEKNTRANELIERFAAEGPAAPPTSLIKVSALKFQAVSLFL